jgi:hypothetical protein
MIQQIAHDRFGQHAVADDVERGELLRPRLGAAWRHHRRHIPVQHAQRVA